MKLWKVSQSINDDYDTYDSFVVAAETEEIARTTSPNSYYTWDNGWYFMYKDGHRDEEPDIHHSWCDPKHVTVQYIGEAAEGITGVICASFHAG